MSNSDDLFTGKWLHHGDWHGKDFSHEFSEYDHDEHPGASGATKMRHARIETKGQTISVWIPAHWSDDEARKTLESNW